MSNTKKLGSNIERNNNYENNTVIEPSFQGRSAFINSKSRGNDRKKGQTYLIENKGFTQRFVQNNDYYNNFGPNNLTIRIKNCSQFSDLKTLFNSQKDKAYFNFIHINVFWGKLISFLYSEHEVDIQTFSEIAQKVHDYIEKMDFRGLSNLSNILTKLLEYADKKKLVEIEDLGQNILKQLFNVLDNQNKYKDFRLPQHLSNLVNDMVKLWEYAKRKDAAWIKEKVYNVMNYTLNILNMDKTLTAFEPQHLSNLANAGIRLLEYGLEDIKLAILSMLNRVINEVRIRGTLNNFSLQALSNLIDDGVRLFKHQDKNEKATEWIKKSVPEALEKLCYAVKNQNNKDLTPQDLLGSINVGVKLLKYTQRPNIQNLKKIALNMLAHLLAGIDNQERLKNFEPKELVTLGNYSIKILESNNLRKKTLALLKFIFTEIAFHNDLINFNPQDLSTLTNMGVRLFKWQPIMECSIDTLLNPLNLVFTKINTRGNLKGFNSQDLSILANAGIKILQYGQLIEEETNIIFNVLDQIFNTVNKSNLKKFSPQSLSNLANVGTKLLEYKDNAWKEKIVHTLHQLFVKVSNSHLENFSPQSLSMLANDGTRLLKYAEQRNKEEIIEVTQILLYSIFNEVNKRRDYIDSFSPQSLLDLVQDGIELLTYAYKNKKNFIEKVTLNLLSLLFSEINIRNASGKLNFQTLLKTNEVVQSSFLNSMVFNDERICNRNLTQNEVQEICNIAWLFCAVDKIELIENWLMPAFKIFNEEEVALIEPKLAYQLYQVFLNKALRDKTWNGFLSGDFLFSEQYLSEILSQRIFNGTMEHWKTFNHENLELIENVWNVIKSILGEDKVDKNGSIWPFTMDFSFCDAKQRWTFIKVNGPMDFREDGSYNLSHQFETKLITKMGFRVVNIDFIDWHRASNKETFLEEKFS